MRRFMKNFAILALAVGAGVLSAATPARATLVLRISDGTPADTVTVSSPTDAVAFTGLVGGFNITGLNFGSIVVPGTIGQSNSPGTPLQAIVMENNSTISNLTGSNQTLTISVSGDGFTHPVSPPDVVLAATGSGSLTQTTGASSFTGTIEGLVGTTLFGSQLADTGTSAVVNKNNGLTIGGTGPTASYSAGVATPGFAINPPLPANGYTVTFINTFTFAGNGQVIQLSGGSSTVSPVPEPATLAMAFAGFPLLGLAAWRRRKLRA